MRKILRTIWYNIIFRNKTKIKLPKNINFSGDGHFLKNGEEFFNYFKRFGLKPVDNVLDIGCGNGRMALPLVNYLNKDAKYEGLDIAKEQIEWCKQHITIHYPNFKFNHINVFNSNYNPDGLPAVNFKLPYSDNYFDFIFLTSVFTHMLPPDIDNYMKEISRVLKTKGKCVITYFLLNHKSKRLIEQGKSVFKFPFKNKTAAVENMKIPEEAVAYEQSTILSLYDRTCLTVESVHYGNWSGLDKKSSLSFQDIIVATKLK